MIDRRQNFKSVALTLHNMKMTSDAILMLGWLDFSGNYALAINGYAMQVVFNTFFDPCGVVMACTFMEWRLQKRPRLLNIVSDAIDGMVGITPACGYIGPVGALCIVILTAALRR